MLFCLATCLVSSSACVLGGACTLLYRLSQTTFGTERVIVKAIVYVAHRQSLMDSRHISLVYALNIHFTTAVVWLYQKHAENIRTLSA